MDEPFSMTQIGQTEDLGRILHEPGAAAINATHGRIKAFRVVDRLIVMDKGKIVQEGAPKEVLESPVNSFVAVPGNGLKYNKKHLND